MFFFLRSNCEDCTGDMVGLLFTWTHLNEIAHLINEKGINRSYESILTIGSFVSSTTHKNEAKTLFKITQTLMMKELNAHVGGNTVWVSHDKTEFQKIREHSHMIWFRKYSNYNVSVN